MIMTEELIESLDETKVDLIKVTLKQKVKITDPIGIFVRITR